MKPNDANGNSMVITEGWAWPTIGNVINTWGMIYLHCMQRILIRLNRGLFVLDPPFIYTVGA